MTNIVFKTLALLTVTVLLDAGCASKKSNEIIAEEGSDYTITTYDNFNRFRFDIKFTSLSERSICLYEDQWANIDTYGQHRVLGEAIKQLDAEIFAISGSETYYPRASTVGGHCEAGTDAEVQKLCSQRIKKGDQLQTSLPYQFFDLEILNNEDQSKELSYTIHVQFCDVFP